MHTVDPFLLTELLRTSAAPVFIGIRRVLLDKQFAIDETALAAFYGDEQGHHAIVVKRGGGAYKLSTPDGVEVTHWQPLSKRDAADYAPVTKVALALARGVRQPPASSSVELQLAGRSDVILMRWAGLRFQRRASFWFADRLFTIEGSVCHGRNDRESRSSFALAADVPADVLLDELPAPPIRLDPEIAVTGLARLQAIMNPPSDATRFILHAGSSVSGTIYNSSVKASTVVRIVFDLETRSAIYTESSALDDS